VYKDELYAEHAKRERIARQLEREKAAQKSALRRLPVPKMPPPQVNVNANLNKGIGVHLRDITSIGSAKGAKGAQEMARRAQHCANEAELVRASSVKQAVLNTYDENTGLFGHNSDAEREHRRDTIDATRQQREVEKQRRRDEFRGDGVTVSLQREQQHVAEVQAQRRELQQLEGHHSLAQDLHNQQRSSSSNMVPHAPGSSKPSRGSGKSSRSGPGAPKVSGGVVSRVMQGVSGMFTGAWSSNKPVPTPTALREHLRREANNEALLHVSVPQVPLQLAGAGDVEQFAGGVEEVRLGEGVNTPNAFTAHYGAPRRL
jgi:hypothetical protein